MGVRTHPIYINFNSGEISPKMEGRIDLDRYFNGVNELKNFICLPQGGVETRGGFHYVAETKTSSKESRLIGFEFSELQNYMIEFGDLYLRFFMDRGQIQSVDANTKLLIHANGDDASTVFTDDGATEHTIGSNGDVQVDIADKKFGSGSALFDGTGDYLSISDHADFNLAATAFTIDLWFHLDSGVGNGTYSLFSQRDDATHYELLYITKSGTNWSMGYQVANGASTLDLTWGPHTTDLSGEWHHVAVVRGWGGNVNDWAVTLDGAVVETDTNTITQPDMAADVNIGFYAAGTEYYWDGRVDEIRLSDLARWTTAFNPPTLEYPLGEGGTAYEITSPYYETDLPFIWPVQSDENMYLCHPDYWPRKLTRTDHNSWTITEVDFIDGPYEDEVTAALSTTAASGLATIALKADGTHFLFYDDEDVKFVAGELLTGSSSTATAKIMAETDWGTEGVLTIAAISGIFQDNEDITDSGTGDATVNGTIGDAHLAYDTEANGPFTVGNTLTGGTTGAAGTIRALQDDGADGKMIIEMTTAVNFVVGEAISDGTSTTAVVTAFTRAHGALFDDDDAGTRFRYYFDTTWTWLEIKSVTDDITAVAIIRGVDITGSADATKYRKGAWSTANGFPRSACFHEGRLLFAGSYEFPNTIWGSKVGEPEDHTPDTEDDDPYIWTAADLNIIRWISPTRLLCVGALDGEATAVGPSDGPITPTDPPKIRSETTHGSDEVGILKIGKAVLFLQKAGRKIREFVYVYEDDAYSAPDLTQLSDHLTEGGIMYLAYQQEPDSVIWGVRSDGVLIGCTYDPSQAVIGWHEHTTDGLFESIATIPYQDTDQLWAIVQRSIDGNVVRYVEYLDPDVHADCALTYSGAPITTLGGLDHLEGKTIQIVGDGAVYPTEVVTGNEVTIEYEASDIYVGIGFTPRLVTNRPEVKIAGTSQMSKKRWNKVAARIIETMGITINGEIIPARTADMDMDTAPTPYSGDRDITNLGWDKDARITVEQPLPLAASIVCILGTLVVGDD